MRPSRLAFVAIAFLLVLMMSPQAPAQSPEYATEIQRHEWLLGRSDQRIIVATDPRESPVRRLDRLPLRWLKRSAQELREFRGQAQPGEFYVFQISLYNNGNQSLAISSMSVDMGPSAADAVCLNEAITQEPGKRIEVRPEQIQPLWIGVEFEKAGRYTGDVRLEVALGESGSFETILVPISIEVSGPVVKNHGVDEGWRLARLKWLLPSDLGLGNSPTMEFKPVKRTGNRITLTSAQLTLDESGLPAQIASNGPHSVELLRSPVQLRVLSDSGEIPWNHGVTTFESRRLDRSSWTHIQHSDKATLTCTGSAEFDGFVKYRLLLEAKETLHLQDVQLHIPYVERAARFQLGLGFRGGFTPASTDWKWNVAYQQDCVWLGDVPIGAQWRFKGSNYVRPLLNIYYGFRPLNLPDSWGNSGKGGIRIAPLTPGTRLIESYSGARTMQPGDRLEFNFDVQITPSRPINTEKQWTTRFYHPNELSSADKIDQAVDTARQAGANVINIHHRKPVNPFINYPFNDFSVPDLKAFVTSAHQQDIRVKLYYTTRELTWQLPEIWALKSFGDSIIAPGPGPRTKTVINPNGAHPLLTEALGDNFISAWTASLDGKYAGKLDLAVITKPDSAWTDYYLHGLDWLIKNVQIDGMYIDDTALDRSSLQRARRILESGRPSPLIDLHSWNHEDPLAARGSSTSIYMELFPYMDRIWLGEGFDYHHATPDYWLISMSGIPYGVMSEMLEGGGNVWRGMLFGETCRLGWSGDPRSMWQFWDRFGMSGTRMIGWWDDNCPVRTDSRDVLATTYTKKGKSLIALANWTDEPRQIRLKLDWKRLGLNSEKAMLTAQRIDGFQDARTWRIGEPITVPGGKGWLIVVQ